LIPLLPQLSQGRLLGRLIFTFGNYAYPIPTYPVTHFPLWTDQLLVILRHSTSRSSNYHSSSAFLKPRVRILAWSLTILSAFDALRQLSSQGNVG